MGNKMKFAYGCTAGAALIGITTSIMAIRKARKRAENAEFESADRRFINWGQEQEIKKLKEENEKLKAK